MKDYPVGIKKSDKQLGGGLYLAASCLYDAKLRDRALLVATVVNRSIDIFRNYLDFSKDVKVRIAPLRGRDEGRCSERGVIELD